MTETPDNENEPVLNAELQKHAEIDEAATELREREAAGLDTAKQAAKVAELSDAKPPAPAPTPPCKQMIPAGARGKVPAREHYYKNGKCTMCGDPYPNPSNK